MFDSARPWRAPGRPCLCRWGRKPGSGEDSRLDDDDGCHDDEYVDDNGDFKTMIVDRPGRRVK